MLAAIDSTAGQVAADGLLVVVVIINMYLGLRHGLLRRVFAFAGVYVGCYAATNIGNGVAGLISPHSAYANAWAFVAIFVAVVIAFEILGHVFNDHLQLIAVVLFNRISGLLVGAFVGLAEVLILFLVALALANIPATGSNGARAARDVQDAFLAGQAVRLEAQAQFVFAPVLPGDFPHHLAESVIPARPPGP